MTDDEKRERGAEAQARHRQKRKDEGRSETSQEREARLVRQRRYDAKPASKLLQAASSKRYRERNPDKAKAANDRWRKANMQRFNENRRSWRCRNVVRSLWLQAKSRSKKRGIEFAITVDDILPMGDCCPLLGLAFSPPEAGRTTTMPSLDRINPNIGYVPGNVWIVGYRANLIKNDGTAEEHERIAAAMRAVIRPK